LRKKTKTKKQKSNKQTNKQKQKAKQKQTNKQTNSLIGQSYGIAIKWPWSSTIFDMAFSTWNMRVHKINHVFYQSGFDYQTINTNQQNTAFKAVKNIVCIFIK
jgi:hypothetical protein